MTRWRIRVALLRLLAHLSFARYGSRLAGALSALGNAEEQAGRLSAAVVCFHEAAVILRRVVRSQHAREGQLATVLYQLCLLLFRLGRHEEEIEIRAQFIDVYEALVIFGTGTREHLAQLVHDQAIAYSHARRRQEAVAAWERTIEMRRSLAQADPDQWPSLAAALRWRSADLAAMGRYAESIPDVTESTEIYRRAAQEDPDAHLVQVAYCLGMAARQLARSGEPAAADRTVNALRQFAFETRRPDVRQVCAEEFDLIARDDAAQLDDEWRRVTEVSYPRARSRRE